MRIKITINKALFVKIAASLASAYAFFEKSPVNVSVFLGIVLTSTWVLKDDQKFEKNRRLYERVCDVFLFAGASFSGLAGIYAGAASFTVVVLIGYLPFFWAKRAHLPRIFVLFLSQMFFVLGFPGIFEPGLMVCGTITLYFTLTKIAKTGKYVLNISRDK